MDGGLLVIRLGLAAAAVGRLGEMPNAPHPMGDSGAPALLALVGVVAIGASTAGVLWLLAQLLRQHERLLARLDRLDAVLAGVRRKATLQAIEGFVMAGAVRDDEDEDEDEALPVPAIGSPAPEVKLPDLDGTIVDVTARRGAPTLLLFWDPECGFCRQLRPALKRWEANPSPGAPTVVLVSVGSIEANKAEGFRSLVLIDDDDAVSESFGVDGTPMAILIDGEGRVASRLASGQTDVLALLRSSGQAPG